jgi:hypothetical protein
MNQRTILRNTIGNIQSENGKNLKFFLKFPKLILIFLISIAHLTAKNNNLTLEQTPRKLPFGDKTNATKKTEQLLQSAVKEKNIVQSSKTSPDIKDENIFEIANFPEDKSCFCCGQDRLSKFYNCS